MSLYSPSGQINTTVVAGNAYTGLYAADGSLNIVTNTSSSYVGLYHPCGALNAVVVTSGGYQNANGSINVISNGSGGYYLLIPGGSGGIDLSQFQMYSAFPGSAGTLVNGFTAEKGGNFATTGTGALNLKLTGTGGAQMSNNTTVSYAYNNTAFSTKPKWIECQFKFTTTVDIPVAIACMTDTSFNLGKALHLATANNAGLTTWSCTMLDETVPSFTPPAWNVTSPGYTLLANELYTIDLVFDGLFSKATMKDHTGATVMSQTEYDPNMASFTGNYFFFEHVNSSSIVTSLVWCKSTLPTGWTWPTINPFFPAGGTGWSDITTFAASVFGGTATQGSGKVTVAGTTFGAGGSTTVGTLALNDVIWFSMDIANYSGLHTYVTLTNGGGATSNILTFTGNGRWQGALTCTTAGAQSLTVCATNLAESNTFSADITTNFLMLKNPPTTP